MQAVIMAGGKGTRMGSLSNDTPKAMLKIGNKPISLHQIECLKNAGITDIIFVIGHLGENIKNYYKNGKNFGVNISYFEETEPLGTGGALYYLKNTIKEDFIVLYGDVFIDIDFKKMINFHKNFKATATLFVHPNSHPFDSDIIICDSNNKVKKYLSKDGKREEYYTNLVNAGIFIFSNKIFKYILQPKKIHLDREIIIEMIENSENIIAYKSTEYVKDIGTLERYEIVNNDYKNKITHNRNLSNKQKCIFLDRDGTINKYVGFLTDINKMELLDRVSTAIKDINNSEYLCIVITNQPIIARGESSVGNLDLINKKMETLLGFDGAYINDLFYCPHHPHSGYDGEIKELKINCSCRKPNTGMIDEAIKKYNIDPQSSYIIGDSTLDIQLGKNTNIKTVLVNTGEAGKDSKYDVIPDIKATDLYDAIQKIFKRKV